MPPMSGVDAVAMSPGRERDDGVHSGTVGGFPASVLLSDDFDAQEFVARARRGTPLDDLLQDLQRHLLQLRESLVDTINHDYATFVGMASNLKGLDAALMRVRLPVNSLREEVGELRNAAAEAVRTMDHRLDERHAVTSQRRRLCLLLDAEQGLQRMEALLARERSPSLEAITDAGGEDPTLAKQAAAADLARTVEVLERVANEGARLKALVRRLNDESSSSAKNDLAQRLQRLEDGLVAQTCGTLGLLLAYPGGAAGRADQGDGAPLAGIERVVEACLRTLVVAERSDACQTVLRQECMRPFVAAAVSVEALEAGVTGSCQGLAAVYARILTFVDRFCLPLAALAASAFPPPSSGVSQGSAPSPLARRSFVLGACLLAELSPVLLSVGGRRVTHYLDKALAGKYKATMALLAALEERCGCRTEAQAFRAHVAVEDLLQKWELPLRAHLQLRQQEATKALQPLLVGPAALSAEMQIRAAARLEAEQAAEKETEGDAGGERHAKPAKAAAEGGGGERPPLPARGGGEMVLVATSAVWASVSDLVAGDEVLPCQAHRLAQLAALLLARFHAWGAEWGEHLTTRLSEADAPSGPVAASAHRKGEEEMASLGALSHDLASLAELAEDPLPGMLASAAGPSSAQARPLVEQLVQAPRAQLLALSLSLRVSLASALFARCAEPLAAVRAVTSQYRMTNKPPPTKPSLYVKGALQPIKTSLTPGGALASLSPPSRRAVVREVVDRLAGRYHDLVQELLVSVRKLGQTLRKLAKAPAGTGEAAGMSDDKKIYLQVLLDVEALLAEVREVTRGTPSGSADTDAAVGEAGEAAPGEASPGAAAAGEGEGVAEGKLLELASTLRVAAGGGEGP